MSKERKESIIKIVLASVLILISVLIEKLNLVSDKNLLNIIDLVLSLAAYIIVGYKVIKEAFEGIINKNPMDENFLMTLASFGAFLLTEYHEGVFVMLFYQVGELFEDIAVDSSTKSIKDLVEIKPTKANLQKSNGDIEEVDPSTVKIDDIVVVKPGEKIPLDGIIIEGESELDTSMLTGESIPRVCMKDDEVQSGLINVDKLIKVKVTKLYEDSTANKIIDLINNSSSKKSNSENFITEFARVYTPIVCIIAIAVFVVPSLFNIIMNLTKGINDFSFIKDYLYRALTILVISCPCAIILSVPLGFFSAIGKASRIGVLIKGSNYIETLSKVKVVAFDKTGTMTKGVFEVVGIHHATMSDEEMLKIASHAEFFSNHPISKSIKRAYEKRYNGVIDKSIIKDTKEISGFGISSVVNGKTVLMGDDKLMDLYHIEYIKCRDMGSIVHVAIDGKYEGHILIRDLIKDDAKEAIDNLKKIGIKKCIMLTGDMKNVGEAIGKELDIDEVHAELTPQGKVDVIEDELSKLDKKQKLAFVGDGINDAPVLKRADVGISMGGLGSDAAIEVSDVVLMNDSPTMVEKIIKLSKRTMIVTYENIILALFIKVLFLVLSSIGISNMWLAVFADVGVMILCVINAIRLMI